jgi:hypothetical protein
MYIGIAIVLFLAIGGLLYWKVKSAQEPEKTLTAATTAAAATPPATALPDPPPPPPPVETDAGQATPENKVAAAGGGGGPCAGKCTGLATPALQSALSGRAGSARGCYERALRVNSMLQGKLVVNVRVDPSGGVCATSIAQDGVHSAEVASCVLGMFRGQRFPAPSGGCIDVNVPMSFVPREGR